MAPLFAVEHLVKSYRGKPVVQDVSFQLGLGEAVALVGASGSGKSTIARLLLRLERADRGMLWLSEESINLDSSAHASLQWRSHVQLVFQDPFASLNPVHTVLHHLERPLLRHRRASNPADARTRAAALLGTVGLTPPDDFLHRYPGELSGGQRQRVAIARALAVEPKVLIADEPTSMLDVSLRAGVLALLKSLQRERGLSIVLITHDLTSARALCDRILVLHQGAIVESGPTEQIISAPSHPYTRALLEAVALST